MPLLYLDIDINYELWKSDVNLVAPLRVMYLRSMPLPSSPKSSLKPAFFRKVGIIFRAGCSVLGAVFIAIWTEFGKVRP